MTMIHKDNCTIFTPKAYAERLLDLISYKENISLFKRKILEFSCGEGAILSEIIRRYVSSCRINGINDKEIIYGLNRDIIAYEINEDIAIKCEAIISNILLNEFQLHNAEYKIRKYDFLLSSPIEVFDFIVGNPPYISYHAMKKNSSKYSIDILREIYTTCNNGSFDYYYPFVEKAKRLLNEHGIMSLLIPSSIFKNKSAKLLRSFIRDDLIKINDFSGTKIFSDALVSTAIITIANNSKQDSFDYEFNDNIQVFSKSIYLGDQWVFSNEEFEGNTRFGDLFEVIFSCATLCNEAFIINEIGSLEIELIRPSGSPKTLKKELNEYIIFPYFEQNGKIIRIEEKDLENNFPNIYNHLSDFKTKLEATDKDASTKWFEYGRTQGIRLNNSSKILMSPMVTAMIHLYNLEDNSVPYSGIMITPINGNNLETAAEILTSARFLRYAHKYGTSRSGVSIQIGTSLIKNYRFDLEVQ